MLEEKFIEIMEKQIHCIAFQECIKDSEYLQVNSEIDMLIGKLKENLTNQKQFKLLDELESAFRLAEAIFLEYAYRQGIKDSQSIYEGISTLGIQTA